jgi:hypothetical protein
MLPGPSVLTGRMLQPSIISSTGKVSTADPLLPPPAPSTATSIDLPLPTTTSAPPPAPSTTSTLTAAPPLPPTSTTTITTATTSTIAPLSPPEETVSKTDIDHHRQGNECFVAKNYHGAVTQYKAALEIALAKGNKSLQGKLQSNLAAAFLRLNRFQEATVASRAAVHLSPTPKAYFRLMKGLEGQRLLPEAIAVGLHALDVMDENKSGSSTTMDKSDSNLRNAPTEKDVHGVNVKTEGDGDDQSRSIILSLLERLHSQTVSKPRTAGDTVQKKNIIEYYSNNNTINNKEGSSMLSARSQELSRRILGLGVYGKENTDVGITSMEQRVNVVNRETMENGAKLANPKAFIKFNIINYTNMLKMYNLSLMDHKGVVKVILEHDVKQGEIIFTDSTPLIIRHQSLTFDATGIDKATCTLFQKLFSNNDINMASFSLMIRRMFAFSSLNGRSIKMISDPFSPSNRSVFRNFSQEMACIGMGTDKMASLKHFAETTFSSVGSSISSNPLSVILIGLHLVRSSLQPFEEDGAYGLTLAFGLPVIGVKKGEDATVGYKTLKNDTVQYIATRDLKSGEALSAVCIGQL